MVFLMTDVTAAPDEPGGTTAKKGATRRRILVPLLIGALFLSGIGGGAALYFGPARLLEALSGPPQAEQVAAESDEITPETPGGGMTEVFLMEDHIVNLVAPEGPSSRFVRVRLAIVYDPALVPIGSLQERKPHLRDAFHGFMSQLTERDLEGSYGLTMLKEELLRRARAVAGNRGIGEVLITDLVIQ